MSEDQGEQPVKRPPGRQKGWTKADNMTGRIPPLRVPDALHKWLTDEARENALKIPDMARMILMKAMKESQKAKALEDSR